MLTNPFTYFAPSGPSGPSGPLTVDLIDWFPLQEAADTSRVGAFAGHVLADNNGVGQTTGKVGANAALFAQAGSDFLSLANADADAFQLGTSDRTFVVWIKLTVESTVSANIWYSMGGKSGMNGLHTGTSASGVGFQAGINGSSQINIFTNQSIDMGTTWHLLISQWDRDDKASQWIDNVANPAIGNDISALDAENIQSSEDLRIGRDPASLYADCSLEQLVVYNRLLTADEKTEFWNSGDGIQFSDID